MSILSLLSSPFDYIILCYIILYYAFVSQSVSQSFVRLCPASQSARGRERERERVCVCVSYKKEKMDNRGKYARIYRQELSNNAIKNIETAKNCIKNSQ